MSRLTLLFTTLVVLLVAACRTAAPVPAAASGANAAADAVERFMKAVEQKDYTTMGWLFGTTEGSVLRRDAPAEVERRMYAVASVLEHQRFVVRNQSDVPGSTTGEVTLSVQVTHQGSVLDVPFTTVRGQDGRWYVEKIGLEAITASRN